MAKILTFGCKVNQYESQLIKENIENDEKFNSNEIVIINSCCVTAKVEKEVKRTIRKLLKEGKKIYLTGCLIQKNSIDELKKDVKIIRKEEFFKFKNKISFFEEHTRAFVKIEDGCENYCSYCIVPYVRGKVRSRKEDEILDEIECLVKNGYKEIVLTGIDLGAYGKDTGENLISLIEKINRIDGVKRIRLSSIEVHHINKSLIDFLKNTEKFCPHFHIPLQSGSDKILKLMRRRYSFKEYYEKIQMIRENIENVTFTTDIMVGFPGEDEEDFEKTVSAVENIKFLKVHVFPYSEREKTPAINFPEKVNEKVKKERVEKIIKISEVVNRKVKEDFIDKSLNVLFERKNGNYWEGYSENYIPVIVDSSEDLKNQILKVKGKKILGKFIYGVIF
ncbi:MAG: tRNA (N(6)-L-threonylcarbamoyladenosine(37)-C(2))-methylthiotransferase MtaB [Candidatus Omnitrophica bacterium]|nr:tRNA (N(6)-L-threonylcarbamoyladenosine(37)-C(2))-methylthiotransferase MtaB [Candidatus Omnitrophota bacterium]